jgi:hypothetical protein
VWAAPLHRLVDRLAIWREDRLPRAPVPFRAAGGADLDCFGPLPPLPPDPPPEGTWWAPSPRPAGGDPSMAIHARPAAGARRGTAVLVPPWKVPGLGAVAGWGRLLARAGHDVWTLVPPRHLERAAPGIRSGEGFVSPDLPALRAAVEQLVLELRLLVALARRRGESTALVGLSLGALGAALAATGAERVERLVLVAPPADLSAVLSGTLIGRRYLELAARAGAPLPAPELLAGMLAPFRAGARRPTAGSVLLAMGSEDRIAPGPATLALARAWGVTPQVYPRGHLTLLFACRALRRDVAAFLDPPAAAPARRAR